MVDDLEPVVNAQAHDPHPHPHLHPHPVDLEPVVNVHECFDDLLTITLNLALTRTLTLTLNLALTRTLALTLSLT